MKYLFLLYNADSAPTDPSSAEYRQLFVEFDEAVTAMREANVVLDCAPLRPASTATTVRIRDDRTLLTDGPAAELKEQVGGYTLVECAYLDEALRWAATIPTARTGSVEVRAVIDTTPPT
jgi:hypothetical protein